jgi:hypothetical protein
VASFQKTFMTNGKSLRVLHRRIKNQSWLYDFQKRAGCLEAPYTGVHSSS